MQKKLHRIQIKRNKKRGINGSTNSKEEVIMMHEDGGKKALQIKQLKEQNKL